MRVVRGLVYYPVPICTVVLTSRSVAGKFGDNETREFVVPGIATDLSLQAPCFAV